jgi:hypothetical protein
MSLIPLLQPVQIKSVITLLPGMEPYLIRNRIEFSQNDPIDASNGTRLRKVSERFIKFNELVHGFIAYESLAYENDSVGIIDSYQLERSND